MNWDQIKGYWHQLSIRLKEKWAKLTKEDFATIRGRRGQLVAVLQEHYGYDKERAETEPDAITHRFASWPL